MAKNPKLLYDNNTWTFEGLKKVDKAIAEIAFDELHLDIYPNQIEIIGSDQMLDAYSSIGLPIMYHHWSFGKNFIQEEYAYRKGLSGLAYEIVINSNPCISYCMEENTMTMQTLVIAHAAYGHNHFFKNNYLFKQWTDADSIIDYLIFAKNFISKCEEEHGPREVEKTLDAAHAIQDYGVDKFKRPPKLNKIKEMMKEVERAAYVQEKANILWSTLPKDLSILPKEEQIFPKDPQENILYFLEKYSPVLEDWQREILRIVRKLAQYFYPQRQTKLMNEGWATFCHYYIMNRLWDKGLLSDGNMLEALHSHSQVVAQRTFDNAYYSGFNPYALGFAMFKDIKRICEEPTEEDREYFPHIVDKPWLEVCLDAVENFKDESFILQFLSPKLIREWRLFELEDDSEKPWYSVSAIQDKKYYGSIRENLSKQYSLSRYIPDVQVINANLHNSRVLELQYTSNNKEKISEKTKQAVLDEIEYLWGYPVTITNNSTEDTFQEYGGENPFLV